MRKEKREIEYRHISFFRREFRELKREKLSFEVQHTAYTKKIVFADKSIIYNDTGKEDRRLLYLINQTRKDGKEFQQYNKSLERNTKFFDLFTIPNESILTKIDLKGAYWEYAKKRGIITNKTDELFKKLYKGESYETSKEARLKALGSLATSKKYDIYKDGKLESEFTRVCKEKTSSVYDEICEGIDELMQETNKVIDGCVYYYWDCVFVFKEYEKEAIDFLKSKDFRIKTGHSKLAYFKTGKTGYLICELEGKQYLTRPEHRALLEEIRDEY